ncbi:MAG TPA: polyprenyl synthetase family protein [Chroococcales cyanobacterium]
MAFLLEEYWAERQKKFEVLLERLIPLSLPLPLFEAMRYAVLQGGKRLRPLLAVACAEALGAPEGVVDTAALAGCFVELIHAHSLVHDDLPCLDNDLLRRGKPTVHAAYGEALALLAGDALLSYSNKMMIEELRDRLEPSLLLRLSGELSDATFDMVRGQVADVLHEGKEVSSEALSFIHRNKTGALILAAVRAGTLIGGGESRLAEADLYARSLGLAFQIVDDILDETATASELGKTPGKDRDKGKATFVKLYGIEGSKIEAERQVEMAIQAVDSWPHPAPLSAIARFVVMRKH